MVGLRVLRLPTVSRDLLQLYSGTLRLFFNLSVSLMAGSRSGINSGIRGAEEKIKKKGCQSQPQVAQLRPLSKERSFAELLQKSYACGDHVYALP